MNSQSLVRRKLFILVFLISSCARAETLNSQSNTPSPAENEVSLQNKMEISSSDREKKYLIDYFSIGLNGYPLPFLSGGFGASLEFIPSRKISLVLSTLTSETRKGDLSLFNLSERTKTIHRSTKAEFRYFFAGNEENSFYLASGYKLAVNEIEHQPGLFQGPEVKQKEQAEGMTGSFGFRLVGEKKKNSHFFVDVSVAYEPGKVEKIEYKVLERESGLFPIPKRAQLNVEQKYDFFPEAVLGYKF